MRKHVEPTIVEKAIESVAGFDQVLKKLEQQVVLKGQTESTLQNYICQIASITSFYSVNQPDPSFAIACPVHREGVCGHIK